MITTTVKQRNQEKSCRREMVLETFPMDGSSFGINKKYFQITGFFWYLMKMIRILRKSRRRALLTDSTEEMYKAKVSTPLQNFRIF